MKKLILLIIPLIISGCAVREETCVCVRTKTEYLGDYAEEDFRLCGYGRASVGKWDYVYIVEFRNIIHKLNVDELTVIDCGKSYCHK